jgi:hypothetical protein
LDSGKLKNLKKHLILAVFNLFFNIVFWLYIYNKPKNRTDQNAHSWWPRKLCKFLSQRQIGRKIQRRPKKNLHERTFLRAEEKVRNKENKIPESQNPTFGNSCFY